MKFNEIERHCADKKRVSSLSPMRKSAFCQREDENFRPKLIGSQNVSFRLHPENAVCSCVSKKNAMSASDHSQSPKEDLDLCKQFSNDEESMWLSSDCSSPSAFFQEYRWSKSYHSNGLGLPSWLSLLARTNSMEKASNLRMQRTFHDEDRNLEEDIKDEQIVTCLLNSATSDADANCFYEEYSRSCGNSTPLSTKSNSSQSLDFERIGDHTSLLNLDGEDNKLIPGTEARFDCHLCDFPSPSYKSSWGDEFQSPDSSTISTPSEAQTEISACDFSSGHTSSEAADLQDLSTDEPLFWPLGQTVDWNSQAAWNYFSMSPRKFTSGPNYGTPPDSISLNKGRGNMDLKEGQRKELLFSSGSTASKIMELKQKYNKGVRRTNALPSRLSTSAKSPEKLVHFDTKDGAVEPERGVVPVSKAVSMVKDVQQEDFASKEGPIEMLLGLAEFDGHEGVDPEFNKDEFSLHVPLC